MQIRKEGKYVKGRPARVAQLTALGFDIHQPAALSDPQGRWDAIYTALLHYKTLYGTADVPLHFEVPADDVQWPEQTWGLKLGQRVKAIRTQSTFVSNSPERRYVFVCGCSSGTSVVCTGVSAVVLVSVDVSP
jgi:hypothetical protein